MLDFFYDSLETLHKVKYPTKKEFINLTILIFTFVIVASLFFVGVDFLIGSAYQQIYAIGTSN